MFFDDSVGVIMRWFEDYLILDDILIIFFSDNGGLIWELMLSNVLLWGGKGLFYEGGVWIFFIVYWF